MLASLSNFWMFSFFFFLILLMFIFERECARGGRAERGRHRIPSRLQALSCQHRARCRAQTHKPWDHDLSQSRLVNRMSHPGTPKSQTLNWLSHPGAQNGIFLKKDITEIFTSNRRFALALENGKTGPCPFIVSPLGVSHSAEAPNQSFFLLLLHSLQGHAHGSPHYSFL